MSKSKNIQQASKQGIHTTPKKTGFWRKIRNLFTSNAKLKTQEEVAAENPLKDISIEELELELLDANPKELGGEPDIEIAFINPETGELEVLNLPQDTFKIRVQDSDDEHGESVVVLELDTPIREVEEEDPYSKITHFPPSSRLH
jgi:hypothetical protein